MRVKSLEVSNFKCFGKKEEIILKPITLLFGPNSSGKSTILQILHYLREILVHGNLNPELPIAGGQLNLGGFKAFVHKHEQERIITLKINIELSKKLGNKFLPLNLGDSTTSKVFERLNINYLVGENLQYQMKGLAEEIGFEIDIKWSDFLHGPFVSKITSEMNNQKIASIVRDTHDKIPQLTNINFEHPFLLQPVPSQPENENSAQTGYTHVPSQPEDENLVQSGYSPVKSELIDLLSDPTDISVELSSSSALPPLDEDLKFSDWDEDYSDFRVIGLRKLFTELVLGPANIAKHCLQQTTCIGPLREIPIRNLKPHEGIDETRWASGLGAWDLLYNNFNGELIKRVNEWMKEETRLNTFYEIERREFNETPILNEADVNEKNDEESVEDNTKDTKVNNSTHTRVELQLKDLKKGIYVDLNDVGVGISQLLPIVVGALCKECSVLAVEQPELHLNPKLQGPLGDLFIAAATNESNSTINDKTLIIETHSEHIILRLLRRIRENYEAGQTSNEVISLSDYMTVYYVENTENGVELHPIEIDKDGNFFGKWPDGFFEERMQELF